MMPSRRILTIIAAVGIMGLQGCGSKSARTVKDIDGNVYHTVTIGMQVWTVENLRVTKYRNGNPIPNVMSNSAWDSTTTGAYCAYVNEESTADTYGYLYNWYAVNDSRNIAPRGWHVPTDEEWQTLINYLGGPEVAGGKMKEVGTSHWLSPNEGATNESGFSALPAGGRDNSVAFIPLGLSAPFWSSSEDVTDPNRASLVFLFYSDSSATRLFSDKKGGFSVRLVKD